jgi:hypothetical protein
MLSNGTVMVVVFSVRSTSCKEIACAQSPFYVSFILAPLASNASEVISSMYYASKDAQDHYRR